MKVVNDLDAYAAVISKGNSILQEAIKKWVRKHGPKYRHGIKDNANFTKFLLTMIRGGNLDAVEYDSTPSLIFRGRVNKARRDRNGFNYGFIQRTPNDVFFHERNNGALDFNDIYGKTVLYRIFTDNLNGEDRAEIIEVLSDDFLGRA